MKKLLTLEAAIKEPELKDKSGVPIERPADLPPRMARLAEVFVLSGSMEEASRTAGYKATRLAARVMKKPEVQQYVEYLRGQVASKIWEVDEILNRIQALAQASKSEQIQIKALELLSRTKGMLTDKLQVELPRRVIIRSPDNTKTCEMGCT